jgi:hypothetical protein
MKIFTLIISFLFIGNVFGQSSDSLGIDNNLTLNRQEINFLNTSLKNSRDTFDFTNKKIAFVTGSSGSKLISKQEYFLTCVRPWTDKGSSPQIFFIRLTTQEKQKSNGYDAVVMSWVKLFTDKQRKRIIEQLSRNK